MHLFIICCIKVCLLSSKTNECIHGTRMEHSLFSTLLFLDVNGGDELKVIRFSSYMMRNASMQAADCITLHKHELR